MQPMDKNQSTFKKNCHAEGKVSIPVPHTPFPPCNWSKLLSTAVIFLDLVTCTADSISQALIRSYLQSWSVSVQFCDFSQLWNSCCFFFDTTLWKPICCQEVEGLVVVFLESRRDLSCLRKCQSSLLLMACKNDVYWLNWDWKLEDVLTVLYAQSK